MIQRPCPRCHTLLTHEDDGALLYCTHCGAPQVVLSEDLLQQAAEQATFEATPPSAPVSDPSLPAWNSLIRSAAGFSVIFALFCFVLPPLALVLPAIVLAFYAARHPQTRLNTALGARVGLLSGVFLSSAVLTFWTCTMLTMRYIAHDMGAFDANLNDSIVQTQARLIAQSGEAGQQSADLLGRFAYIPEFRAGSFLVATAFVATLFILLTVFGGAFAGYLGGRRQPSTTA